MDLNDPATARAWFADVIEPLADSFDPANVDRYVRLFAEMIECVDPSLKAEALIRRYDRIRQPHPFSGPDPTDVFVLSRVTLGADVAITSVCMDAAKRRFPNARIWFTGPRKGYELFLSDPRIGYAPAAYDRTGSIRDRIEASRNLATVVDLPGSIVIDPDSRLAQLGLVPLCAEEQYVFFESRSSKEAGTLSELAERWVERTFGISEAKAYIAPPPPDSTTTADITVSLGVGENPAKRVADPFERNLIEALAGTSKNILVDKGAGGEESERVVRATEDVANVHLFEGSFAAFARYIAESNAYIGYDSAGQHAAAAFGVPLVAVFAGYPNERFLERWRPSGEGRIEVVRAKDVEPAQVVDEVIEALARLGGVR